MPPVAITTPILALQVMVFSPLPTATPTTLFAFSSKKNFCTPMRCWISILRAASSFTRTSM